MLADRPNCLGLGLLRNYWFTHVYQVSCLCILVIVVVVLFLMACVISVFILV